MKHSEMEMEELYNTLKNHKMLKDKIKINECHNFITIDFHEYLSLSISNDLIEFNKGLTHWHPVDNSEVLESLDEMINDEVYIENRVLHLLRILSKSKFEKKKKKYFMKKHLRIYTTHEILKHR